MSKAPKNYIWSYRDEGAFHEAVTNQILDDLVDAIKPRFMRLKAIFNVRGGIYTTVVAEHRQKGWSPQDVVTLQLMLCITTLKNLKLLTLLMGLVQSMSPKFA